MRWKRGRRRSNIEDRRGQRPGGGAFRGGIGTIVIALALGYFPGIDPSTLLKLGEGPGSAQTCEEPRLLLFTGPVRSACVIAHRIGHHVQTLPGTSKSACTGSRRASSTAMPVNVRLTASKAAFPIT